MIDRTLRIKNLSIALQAIAQVNLKKPLKVYSHILMCLEEEVDAHILDKEKETQAPNDNPSLLPSN